ncbi:MAG TPA: hypothetical protein VGF67_11455 [Ktedonobacteraceae bacterium]|jgi:hypothetical protein
MSQEITHPLHKQQSAVVPQVVPVAVPSFWETFRLFPSAFDASGFTYWYIYVSGLTLFALFPLFLHLLTRSSPGEIQFYTDNKLIIVLISLTMIIVVTTYNYWKNRLPQMFQELEARERLSCKDTQTGADFAREFQAFLEEYQAALLHRRRYILIVGFVLTCIGLFVSLIYGYLSAPASPLLLAILPVPFFLGYFLGASAWTLYVTGDYLRQLPQRFEIEVEPWHPDGCGGLRIMGNFCLRMALPILTGVMFFGLYGIGTFFLPGLLSPEQQVIQISANVGLLIIDIPLAALAFFRPLLGIHAEMVRKKQAYEEQFAGHLKRLYNLLGPALERGNPQEIKQVGEEIEVARRMHPLVTDYPGWPFNRRILFTYLLPQVFALLSAVLPIVSALLPVLKK